MKSDKNTAKKDNSKPNTKPSPKKDSKKTEDKKWKNPWQKLTKKKRKEIIQNLKKFAFIALIAIIPFAMAFTLYMLLPDIMSKRVTQPEPDSHAQTDYYKNEVEPETARKQPREVKSTGSIPAPAMIPPITEPKPEALEIKPSALMESAEDTSEKRKFPISDSLNSPLIAIIIDDFGPGLNRNVIKGFIELPFDITLAIMPGNDLTVKTSESAMQAGKESMIHLPMEPIDSVAMDERDMVYCSMDSAEVVEILDRAQAELPYALGMNNHMGSKATSDSTLMAVFANLLSDRGLFFIDSRTTPNSCGLKTMRQQSVPSAGRDIFLDFTDDPKIIRQQIYKASRIAERRGWAIAIGHARRETLEVLKNELPILQSEGFTFVSASRLLEIINGKSH